MKANVIILFLNILLVSSNVYAKTFFVSQNGNGNKNGESYSNRMSVTAHNKTSFEAGDIIYLCDTITSSIRPRSNGSVGNPIVYRGDYPGHLAIINRASYAFNLENRSYITLTNKNQRAIIDGKLTESSSLQLVSRKKERTNRMVFFIFTIVQN